MTQAAHLALLLIGLLWHLPGIGRPFSAIDVNGAGYVGAFVRMHEYFGFLELRGLMLAEQLKADPRLATVYTNHPPGLIWLSELLGTSEAAMRLPTALLVIVAALFLFELLRTRTNVPVAALAAVLFLGLPSNALLCHVSLETALLGCGLPLLVATERVRDGHRPRRWRIVQGVATFIGTWVDWQMAFSCAALLPLTLGRPRLITSLAVPFCTGLAALASILAWQSWALAAPFLAGQPAGRSIGELIDTTIRARPALGAWLAGGWERLGQSNTHAVALAAVPGCLLLLRRDPRLFAATALIGLLPPVLFAQHATDHYYFWAYLGPLFAAGLATPAASRHTFARWPGLALLLAATVVAWSTSYTWMRQHKTTLFRDLGAVLTAAADMPWPAYAERPPGGWLVASNFPFNFPYYARTPAVIVPPRVDVPFLEAARHHRDFAGLRYLWADFEGLPDAWSWLESPELEQWLAGHPRERVPELEQSFWSLGDRPIHVREAWLVTLPR